MPISVHIDSRATKDALDAMLARVAAATVVGVGKAGLLIEGKAKQNMGGSGPNVITGTLRRSIVMEGPIRTGSGTATARVGPSVIYGRIQELGGTIAARNAPYLMASFPDGSFAQVSSVTLPPRPYLGPAVRDAIDSGAVLEVMSRTWREALG